MNRFEAGRIAGIPVVFNQNFILLVALFGLGYLRAGTPEHIIVGVFAVVGGVGSILLHELAHAYAARLACIRPLYIELHGLGGACHYDREPQQRVWRIIISLSGPAANFALWGLFHFIADGTLMLLPQMDDDLPEGEPMSGWFRLGMSLYIAFSTLSSLNIAMCIFNLLPSFPLDGGKALWEMFSGRFDLAIGTRIIATCGFVVCGWCLYRAFTTGSMWTLVIAWSLFLANQQALQTLGQRRWQRWD